MKNMEFDEVKRTEFDEIADLIGVDSPYFSTCTVFYNGTNLRGHMSIKFAPGCLKEQKEIIEKVAEILTR